MFLLFDVSANGKPKKWNVSAVDTFNWPRLFQFCWLVYDKKGNLEIDKNYYIKDDFELSLEAIEIHKVDMENYEKEAQPLKKVLAEFKEDVQSCIYAFSFNQTYNENVVKAEYYRHSMETPFTHLESFCLMRESTYFCRIPGPDGRFKWPSLTQLHSKLFGAGFDNNGNAKYDLMAVSRCFNKLLDLGQLDDLF